MQHKEKRMFGNAKASTFNNARNLRICETEAEKLLWERLRNKKFHGLKFRRQHPYSKYILDFYCHKLNLAIELDGEVHKDTDQRFYDMNRSKELSENGIVVVRFYNYDVIKNTDEILARLELIIKDMHV